MERCELYLFASQFDDYFSFRLPLAVCLFFS